MIRGDDILSKESSAVPESIAKGYVVTCNSPSGICFDILDNKSFHDGRLYGDFPKRKPRAKFYFMYTSTTYRTEFGGGFSRTEYYLQDGTPIYVNDCYRGHGHCNHVETNKVAELFKQYRLSSMYRKKVNTKPKPKRVIKRCRCKK